MQNKIATFGIFATVREILAAFYDVDVDFELSHTQLCAKISDRVQSSLGRNIFRIQENGDGGVVTEPHIACLHARGSNLFCFVDSGTHNTT